MGNVFVTADTHFGHHTIISCASRPFGCVEGMDEILVERWNKRADRRMQRAEGCKAEASYLLAHNELPGVGFARSLGRLAFMDVYFNPNCSNCQTLQSILEERGVDAHYVRYLEQAPSREEIERVMGLLGLEDPGGMIRTKEPVYAELGLDSAEPAQLLDAMAAHPILIQRPIVVLGDRAVIARPPERVLELLDSSN